MTNPHLLAYAKAHGRTPDEMLLYDRARWPGGTMAGFVLWINQRKQAFYREHPEHFLDAHTIGDLGAWSAYLAECGDRGLEGVGRD